MLPNEGSQLSLLKKKMREGGSSATTRHRRSTSDIETAIHDIKNLASSSSRNCSLRDMKPVFEKPLAESAVAIHLREVTPEGLKPEPRMITQFEAVPQRTELADSWSIRWTCGNCEQDCIPVRSESRCICGHRLKEHVIQDLPLGPREQPPKFKCNSRGCACKHFFYIVAEGAWILRCRCKHKHIEHDCSRGSFLCKKPRCTCSGFDSPWVCNCGHPWGNHKQVVYKKQNNRRAALLLGMEGGDIEGCQRGQEDGNMILSMANELINELDLNYRNDGCS